MDAPTNDPADKADDPSATANEGAKVADVNETQKQENLAIAANESTKNDENESIADTLSVQAADKTDDPFAPTDENAKVANVEQTQKHDEIAIVASTTEEGDDSTIRSVDVFQNESAIDCSKMTKFGLPVVGEDNDVDSWTGQDIPITLGSLGNRRAMDDGKLSVISRQYDRGNKGYLDNTEKALRELDTSNRGYLNLDIMYDLMKDMQKEAQKGRNLKKGITILAVFALILALSNLGTAFLAVSLSKETSIQHGDLTDKATGETLGTIPKGHTYSVDFPDVEQRRVLDPESNIVNSGSSITLGKHQGDSSIPKKALESIAADDCPNQTPVTLGYTCSDGSSYNYNLDTKMCPAPPLTYPNTYTFDNINFVCPESGSKCSVTGLPCSVAGGAGVGEPDGFVDEDPVKAREKKDKLCQKIKCTDFDGGTCSEDWDGPPTDEEYGLQCACCGSVEEADNEKVKMPVGEIRKMIVNLIEEGEVAGAIPDKKDILQHLTKETGYSEDDINMKLEKHPSIEKEISDAYDGARTRKAKSDVKIIARILQKEAQQGKTVAEALQDLNMTEREIDVSFRTFATEEDVKNVKLAFGQQKKKANEKKEKVRGKFIANKQGNLAYLKDEEELPNQANVNIGIMRSRKHKQGNLTYLKDEEELPNQADVNNGSSQNRKLTGVPSIMQTMRRLQKELPVHTNNFQRHMQEAAGTCSSGTQCIANELTDLSDKMSLLSDQVIAGLQPLSLILEGISKAGDRIELADTIATAAYLAFKIISSIPSFGTPFKPIPPILQPFKDKITTFSNKVGDFLEKLGDRWAGIITKVFNTIEKLASILPTLAGAADLAATVKEAPCTKEIFSSLAGVDVFQPVESAASTLLSYARDLNNALSGLKDALISKIWEDTRDGLQSALAVVQPLMDLFEPLEPLGTLINTKVSIPWFSMPYMREYVGSPYCKSKSSVGYYSSIGTFSWNTCWEETPIYWHVPTFDQYKFKINCNHPSLNAGSAWDGTCYNRNKYRDFREYWQSSEYDWWGNWVGPSCYGKYGYGWNRHSFTHCGKKCCRGCYGSSYYSYTKQIGNYCYKDSCPSYFSMSGSGKYCNAGTRNIKWHYAICDRYNNGNGVISLQNGGCYRVCESGYTEWLGWCIPDSLVVYLDISIKDIMDAFQDALEFIEGLPIVSTILGAIDTVVSTVLGFLTSMIDTILEELGIQVPSLPDISFLEGLLPFPSLDSLNIPDLPDLSALKDLPRAAASTALQTLPLPDDIKNCNTDIGCMMNAMGLGGIQNAFDRLQQVNSGLSTLPEKLDSIVSKVKCDQWDTYSIPVTGMLSNLGLDIGDVCNIDIPVCGGVSIENTEEDLRELFEIVEPLLQIADDLISGRRELRGGASRGMQAATVSSVYKPVMSLAANLPASVGQHNAGVIKGKGKMIVMEKEQERSAYAKGSEADEEEQVVGLHLESDIGIQLDLGYNKRFGQLPDWRDLVIKISLNAKLQVAKTSGVSNLFKQVIETLEEQRKHYPPHRDSIWTAGNGTCYRLQSTTYQYVPKSAGWTTICKLLKDAEDMLEEDVTTPTGCKLLDMKKKLPLDESKDSEVTLAVKCARHWFKKFNGIADKKAEFEVEKAKKTADEDEEALMSLIGGIIKDGLSGIKFHTSMITGSTAAGPVKLSLAQTDLLGVHLGWNSSGFTGFDFGAFSLNDVATGLAGVVNPADTLANPISALAFRLTLTFSKSCSLLKNGTWMFSC